GHPLHRGEQPRQHRRDLPAHEAAVLMVQLIRVSSRTTFAQKRVFPFVWFGVVAAMIAGILVAQGQPRSPPLAAILGPLVIGVIGFVAMKRSVFDLVDQVWDAGADLVIKNRG